MVPLIAIGIASIYACLSSVAELVLNRNIDPDRKGLLQLAALGVPAYILCMIVIAVWRANLYPSEEVGSALSVAVQRYFITMFITPIFALPFVYAVKGIIAMPEVVKKGCLRIMLDIIVYESPAIWVILIVAYSSGDNNALVWLLVVGFITIPLWLVSLFLRALMS